MRQLRDAQDQLVKTVEGVYINILEAEAGLGQLERGRAAARRAAEEMNLRYSLGQISALTLRQVEAQCEALDSQYSSLETTLAIAKLQLEQLTGAPLTGKAVLEALPTVTAEDLAAVQLTEDLAAARAASYELFDAQQDLDDARKTYNDAIVQYFYTTYQFRQAEHVWRQAQLTYEGISRDYDLRFRILVLQLQDNAQKRDAAAAALRTEELAYEAVVAKQRLGNASEHQVLDAQDQLDTARDTLASAERTLYASWNDYRWAVTHGILN